MTIEFERRVKLALWAMMILFGVAAWLAFQNSKRFIHSTTTAAKGGDVLGAIQQLDNYLLEAQAAVRGFLITGDPAFQDRQRTAFAAAQGQTKILLKLADGHEALTPRLAAAAAAVESALAANRALAPQFLEHGVAAAGASTAWANEDSLTAQARGLLAVLASEEHQMLNAGGDASLSNDRLSLRVLYGLIVGAFAALCGSMFLIENNLARFREADAKLKQLNSRLEAANDALLRQTLELKNVNEELEAFSYSVSHDLRAPIRHIGGFLKLLRSSLPAPLPAKSEGFFTTIAESTREMGVMVDELLAFSRVGRAELNSAKVPLEEVLADVRKTLAPEIANRVIVWNIDVLPTVWADRGMIRLVLLNLISNAVKYTRERAEAKIDIGCDSSHADEWIVRIQDNGVGFDMQYAGKLFGVFQRLHQQEEFEGIGIGLANVRRIVHRHGGRVWAEGEVGRGAAFYFSLPKDVK